MILSLTIQQTQSTSLPNVTTLPDGSTVTGTTPSFTISCIDSTSAPVVIVFATDAVDRTAFDAMFPANTKFFVQMPDAPAAPTA